MLGPTKKEAAVFGCLFCGFWMAIGVFASVIVKYAITHISILVQ